MYVWFFLSSLYFEQCSRNHLSLASQLVWDSRLIAYRSINWFYRSTIYRLVFFFHKFQVLELKVQKICYAKTTLEYWTIFYLDSLHLNQQRCMVKFELMYTSTRLLAKKASLKQTIWLPNRDMWQNSGYFGQNIGYRIGISF
jgi:hypothetical protein